MQAKQLQLIQDTLKSYVCTDAPLTILTFPFVPCLPISKLCMLRNSYAFPSTGIIDSGFYVCSCTHKSKHFDAFEQQKRVCWEEIPEQDQETLEQTQIVNGQKLRTAIFPQLCSLHLIQIPRLLLSLFTKGCSFTGRDAQSTLQTNSPRSCGAHEGAFLNLSAGLLHLRFPVKR